MVHTDHTRQSPEAHKGKSAVLLELETDHGNHSASSLESKLLLCKRDDFLKSHGAKSEKSCILNQKPNTCAVPESGVLGKVKNFLGVISEANKKLQVDAEGNSEKYDIELLNGNETELIEMDLMLGIADLHTPEAVAAAESAMAGHQPTISLAAGDSSDDDDDDSDDNDDDEDEENKDNNDVNRNNEDVCGSDNGEKMLKAVAESSSTAVRKQPLKKRPKIVELS